MNSAQLNTILAHVRRMIGGRSGHDLSDRQLLERFAATREEAAFAALVERHGPLVRGVCRRLLPSAEDAEDVFQATFLVLARKAPAIRWRDSVGSWLYQVAYRLALKTRVHTARRLARETTIEQEPSCEPSQAEAWRDLCGVLDHELQQLSERYRAPLLLCYLEGKTRDEAAQQLGWSLGTLKRRLERGRELLRARLARRGLPFTAGLLVSALALSAASAAVPAALHVATVRGGLLFARGQVATTVGVSAQAAALAEGMLHGMGIGKAQWVAAALLMLTVLGTGAGAVLHVASSRQDTASTREEGSADAGQLGVGAPVVPEVAAPTYTDQYGDLLPPGALARVGTLRLRHVGRISSLVFSADGRTVASASEDSSVRLWDAKSGKELRHFAGHSEPVRTLSFSADGSRLASGSYDGTVRVWDVKGGNEVRSLPVGFSPCSLALTPDGRRLVVGGSFERRLVLRDVDGGREVRHYGGQGVIFAVALAPDGKLLASAGDDDVVRLRDVDSGQIVKSLSGHQGRPWTVAFSPDGKRLASAGGDGTIRVWDVASGTERKQLTGHRGDVWSVAFSFDGKQLTSAGQDKTLRLWDVEAGKELPALRRPAREVTAVACSPAGPVFAAGGHDRVVHLWDAEKQTEVCQFVTHAHDLVSLSYSGDSKLLATGGPGGPCLWAAADGKQVRQLTGNPGEVTAVAFSANGKSLMTFSDDQSVRLWDVASGKVLHQLADKADPACWAFSPDGKTVALRGGNNSVMLHDLTTGKPGVVLQGGTNAVVALAFSADGRTLAAAEGGDVRVWDVAVARQLRHFPGPQDRVVKRLALSPDGRVLASIVSTDPARERSGTLRLYGIETGKVLHCSGGAEAECLAFSADGHTLAAAGTDRVVRLWEVATGRERHHFAGHQDRVSCLAFAPDGRTLASGSDDRTALVWDVTGRLELERRPAAVKPFEALWADLAGDSGAAQWAVWSLTVSPQTVPFLAERLRPIKGDVIDRLVADLGNDRFPVREQASRDLEALGRAAEPALRRALEGKPPLEVRRRVEQLLDRLEQWEPSTEQLRAVRAIEVLERIGSPEARQLLQKLAGGEPQAGLTREARAALNRLDNRPNSKDND